MLAIAWLLCIYLSILKVKYNLHLFRNILYVVTVWLTHELLFNIVLVFVCLGHEGESVSILSDVVKQGILNNVKSCEAIFGLFLMRTKTAVLNFCPFPCGGCSLI